METLGCVVTSDQMVGWLLKETEILIYLKEIVDFVGSLDVKVFDQCDTLESLLVLRGKEAPPDFVEHTRVCIEFRDYEAPKSLTNPYYGMHKI